MSESSNPLRAIGFQQGQLGDLVISTALARAFKRDNPGSHLTLGVNECYRAIVPLFHDHPFYDDVHIYTTYDGWPGVEDMAYLRESQFDCVFHAMPRIAHDWFRYGHQTKMVGAVHGVRVDDETCVLKRWFEVEERVDSIAFAPFAGSYNAGNSKALSVERAQQIVDALSQEGYNVVQLGGPGEPRLNGAEWEERSYFESVRAMLGCRALIHSDTGMGWVCSAYQHPQVGLYSHEYYGEEYIGNIQPRNLRGQFCSAQNVNQISVDNLLNTLRMVAS